MTIRTFVLLTHRWIGLSGSLVLSIAGLTGAVLAWKGAFPLRGTLGRLHESLAMGGTGAWIVFAVTLAALPLQLGGLVLWWRRKAFRVELGKGWRRACFDLHNVLGVVGAALMFVLAATAIGQRLLRGQDDLAALHRAFGRFHTGHEFPLPVRVAYSLASAGFLVQSLTGLSMWWRLGKSRRSGGGGTP